MSKERLEELLNEAACIYDAPGMAQVAEHLIKNNVVVMQRVAAQEQIDELESVLYEANHKKSVLDYRWLATAAYNAGYRKQSEWISVDERLPELHTYVITYDTVLGDVQIDSVLSNGEFVIGYNVTHWMPIPEAPKMKGGASDGNALR